MQLLSWRDGSQLTAPLSDDFDLGGGSGLIVPEKVAEVDQIGICCE